MSTVVGTKGQVTIEKGIRDTLGVQPGWRAIQALDGDQVVIRFRPPQHRRSLLGILGGADVPRLDGEAFQEAVERAWDIAAVEAVGSTSDCQGAELRSPIPAGGDRGTRTGVKCRRGLRIPTDRAAPPAPGSK